jgi:hypothetical protein
MLSISIRLESRYFLLDDTAYVMIPYNKNNLRNGACVRGFERVELDIARIYLSGIERSFVGSAGAGVTSDLAHAY